MENKQDGRLKQSNLNKSSHITIPIKNFNENHDLIC